MGAIFLQQGLESARRIVSVHLSQSLEREAQKKPDKQILHEWSQKKYHKVPLYREVSRSGPAHSLSFVVAVEVGGMVVAEGKGGSKKKATIAAAKIAVERLKLK